MFGKIADSPAAHLIILALGVGAVFIGLKFGANYLPSKGFGAAIKRVVNAI